MTQIIFFCHTILMIDLKYLIIGLIGCILILITYIIYSQMTSTHENLSMGSLLGTINQLYASGPHDSYLTTDPIPYDPWLYNPFTFWNASTRTPFSSPYYIGIENYYRDGIYL